MKQLRATLIILALLMITFSLFACGSSVEPIPKTVPLPVNRTEVPRISAEQLKMSLDKGEDILVIDTRSSGTYNFRHIPGAIMEPESFDAIARDQKIITYCS